MLDDEPAWPSPVDGLNRAQSPARSGQAVVPTPSHPSIRPTVSPSTAAPAVPTSHKTPPGKDSASPSTTAVADRAFLCNGCKRRIQPGEIALVTTVGGSLRSYWHRGCDPQLRTP
jgi:hypothetical protein